jgi:hypothetical protein
VPPRRRARRRRDVFAVASFYSLPLSCRYWLIVADHLKSLHPAHCKSNKILFILLSMVKENSPPSAKTGSPPDSPDLSPPRYGEMSDEDKAASKNIGKFLASLPSASRSQFFAAVSSKEFLESFSAATATSGDSAPPQVKFEYGDDDYAAFAAKQAETSKEEYEHYKHQYNATTLFGKAKVPVQTFASGFQVSATPRLGDQSLTKVVLLKDDRGDTPLARQKTREKVV